jgi:long-chain acyl-CoA synthetase
MTALVTVNLTQAQTLAGMEKLKGKELSEVVRAEPVATAVKDAVTRVNQKLADFERIRRFRILDREFTIEQGELTPTMKVRRGRVLENHRTLVSQLYLGKAESN